MNNKKKIVVIPLELIEDDIKKGRTFQYLEEYYNPMGYFDEVYCLSPGGKTETIGKVRYIQAEPKDFKKIIEQINPCVVRAYGGFSCCDWAVASRVEGVPVVVSVHDTNPELLHSSIKYADYIICMSKAVKDVVLNEVEVNENKIYVMPNRVDTELYSKKKNEAAFDELYQKYGRGKNIIHVGRKVKQKNLETVIKAMQYLPKDYKVIFIGPGNVEEYKKLSEMYGVSSQIFFIDHLNNKELSLYYSWCDCMCVPSRWEGFGIVFIEAAACECAIVTSNIAPMNEFLENNVNSLLVNEYENPEKLAEAIKRACNNDIEMQQIKANARKVGLKFDKNEIDKQEIEIYKEIISKGADNQILKQISDEMKKPIILFGAGNKGKEYLQSISKDRVAFFVDNDMEKVGKSLDGIKIISYSTLQKIYKEYNIIVTPAVSREIEQQLKRDQIDYMLLEWSKFLDVGQKGYEIRENV